jgi:flavin reductase (DIM6/NTAB) family NADH-FMN oxidoreductase RutF
VAAQFFKPKRRVGDKFEDLESELAPLTGCPVLKDCLGYVECQVVGRVEKGDHTVYVAEVIGAGGRAGVKGLALFASLIIYLNEGRDPSNSKFKM